MTGIVIEKELDVRIGHAPLRQGAELATEPLRVFEAHETRASVKLRTKAFDGELGEQTLGLGRC